MFCTRSLRTPFSRAGRPSRPLTGLTLPPSLGAGLALAMGLAACGKSDEGPPLPLCSAALPAGQAAAATDPGLPGAGACAEGATAAVVAAPDLQVAGFRAVSPAVLLRLDRAVPARGLDLTIPLRLSDVAPDLKDPKDALSGLVLLARFGNEPAHVAPLGNPQLGTAGGGQLRLHLPGHDLVPRAPEGTLGDLGTFQLAVRDGKIGRRRFTYRAIGGVSMGGVGSSMNFFRHPERYDAIGVMGADPGPDLTYTQGFIRDFFFGGFCTAADEKAGRGKLGARCEPQRKALPGQREITGDFERMPIQQGEGIGLTLRRSLFLRANRDLVRALGNWAYHNPGAGPGAPYLPPGVPAEAMQKTPAEICERPVVLKGFYDGRFNPEGKSDVISFCDGGEADGQPGVFDGSKPQRDPAQILLAVDLNGNGKRDGGEPVITQQGEPFSDLGPDGLPSAMEPGYDPIKNPDPAGDDYHYLKNPGGTEGNWRYDAGEPYADSGIDGVQGKGCPAGSAPGCYDLGEGNGRYDWNGGIARWQESDPHTLIDKMDAGRLAQLDIYYDAGIRDFFNAHVSTNSLFGALAARGEGALVYDGFPALLGLAPTQERQFQVRNVDIRSLGRRAYVRYGNPELTDEQAAMTGDGRHVGTTDQAISRVVMLFSYLLSRWPDLDRTLQSADDPRLVPKAQMFTQKNGRTTPYSIVLPPGYFEPQNEGVRYPIIYFGHGYGMDPEDLGKTTGSVLHSFMSSEDEQQRLPKAILVFLDGKCRPGGDVPNGPLPAGGDLCEEGGFYTNHPEGTYRGEDMIDELDALLSAKYRVRQAAEVEVPY